MKLAGTAVAVAGVKVPLPAPVWVQSARLGEPPREETTLALTVPVSPTRSGRELEAGVNSIVAQLLGVFQCSSVAL